MPSQLLSIGLMIISTISSSLGSFFLKVASKKFAFNINAVITNLPLFVAVSLHFTSAIIGVIAYKGAELSLLVPFASLNYIWASLLAIKFLGEKMNKWKWLGMFLIMLGITLVSYGGLA